MAAFPTAFHSGLHSSFHSYFLSSFPPSTGRWSQALYDRTTRSLDWKYVTKCRNIRTRHTELHSPVSTESWFRTAAGHYRRSFQLASIFQLFCNARCTCDLEREWLRSCPIALVLLDQPDSVDRIRWSCVWTSKRKHFESIAWVTQFACQSTVPNDKQFSIFDANLRWC